MFKFIKHHSRVFIIILCVLASVALAFLTAFFVIKGAKQAISDEVIISYISETVIIDSVESIPEATTPQTPVITEPQPTPIPDPVVINAYVPYKKQEYPANSSFYVIISARPDSSAVTATFNGQTINLEPKPYDLNPDGTAPEFVDFVGNFMMPGGNENNIDLGKIKFYAEWGGYSKTYYSPSIVCLRDPVFDRPVVVEIVADSAETFNGNTTDDYSDPRNSYLPKGTVDYKVGDTVFDQESGKYYYNLRCGKRVYVQTKNTPDTNMLQVSNVYAGELPDVNQISFVGLTNSDNYTYISFNTDWKAPFAVSIEPQQYINPAELDFAVQSVTYSYVDIKFYYATAINGDFALPENPIFSYGEVFAQEGGNILRLYLKNTDAFCGWDSYYNSAGQLEFKFLNSKTAAIADNWYGADLTGITVLLDVGHGGRDLGALGLNPALMPESERNLNLAYKVKAELESIGATVIMTRYNDKEVTVAERCALMRNTGADLCVSIHHDGSENANKNGASVYCFNAFSDKASSSIFERINAAGIYGEVARGWHYFYMGRITACPLVLIENGYISNAQDFNTIANEEINNQKAYAITLGIADYFLGEK